MVDFARQLTKREFLLLHYGCARDRPKCTRKAWRGESVCNLQRRGSGERKGQTHTRARAKTCKAKKSHELYLVDGLHAEMAGPGAGGRCRRQDGEISEDPRVPGHNGSRFTVCKSAPSALAAAHPPLDWPRGSDVRSFLRMFWT